MYENVKKNCIFQPLQISKLFSKKKETTISNGQVFNTHFRLVYIYMLFIYYYHCIQYVYTRTTIYIYVVEVGEEGEKRRVYGGGGIH